MRNSFEIINLLEDSEWKDLTEQIRDELYTPNFPVPSEKMSWSDIVGLLEATENMPAYERKASPAYFMLVASNSLLVSHKREIVGLVLITYYPISQCGLVAYMAIDKSSRGQGLSHELMDHGTKLLREYANQLSRKLMALFGEVREPYSNQGNDRFDPHARLKIWAKHGAKILSIPYVMAPLGQGLTKVYNLNLVAFPVDNTLSRKDKISTDLVYMFLEELYKSSGISNPQTDFDFQRMTFGMDEDKELTLVCVAWERTYLPIRKYGIAFHFYCNMKNVGADHLRSSPHYQSYERDLLAFSWQEQYPFHNEVLDVPEEFRHLKLEFSPSLTVERNGKYTRIFSDSYAGENPPHCRRSVLLNLSRTVFEDRNCILHFVLGPDPEGESGSDAESSSYLSEWDIVKLMSGWDAGNGNVVEPERDPVFTFQTEETGSLSLGELIKKIVKTINGMDLIHDSCHYGTTQIINDKPPKTWNIKSLSAEINKVVNGKSLPKCQESIGRLMAVNSLLLGDQIDAVLDRSELQEAFNGLNCENERIQGVHKGTLLEIVSESAPFDTSSGTIGISPYVLFPQAVAIYNYYLQQEALASVRESDHAKDKKCRQIGARIRLTLSRTLPDIFHYSDEQWYYSKMMHSRGLNQRKEVLEYKLAEIESRYESARKKSETRLGLTIAIFGPILALGQIVVAIETLKPGIVLDLLALLSR